MFLTTASQLADGMEQWMLRLTPNHTVSSATDMFVNFQYGAMDAAPPKGLREKNKKIKMQFPVTVKPVLNWANVCSPEHTSDTSTNYDLFLN